MRPSRVQHGNKEGSNVGHEIWKHLFLSNKGPSSRVRRDPCDWDLGEEWTPSPSVEDVGWARISPNFES